jgi:hypothetical protein
MLRGSLKKLPLADILRLLAGSRVTGRLAVTRTTAAGTITFLKGGVVGAALDTAPGADADDLDAAIVLLDGSGGEFTMRLGPVREGRRQDVEQFLTAVARRRARSDDLVAELGGPHVPVRFSPRLPAKREEATLDAVQWRLAVLVDGRRSLSELARAAGLSTFRAATALVGMLRSGLLVTPTKAARLARKAPARGGARAVAAQRGTTRARARATTPPRGATKTRPARRVARMKPENSERAVPRRRRSRRSDRPSASARRGRRAASAGKEQRSPRVPEPSSGAAEQVRRVLDLGR